MGSASFRFPEKPLTAQGAFLRKAFAIDLRRASEGAADNTLRQVAGWLEIEGLHRSGDAGLGTAMAILARPFGDEDRRNALTWLLAAHAPSNAVTREAIGSVMHLQEVLCKARWPQDSGWWMLDTGDGDALALAIRSGDTDIVERLSGPGWWGGAPVPRGLREARMWPTTGPGVRECIRASEVFPRQAVVKCWYEGACAASADRDADTLLEWLRNEWPMDSARALLQCRPGALRGHCGPWRLMEAATLGLLDIEVRDSRMKEMLDAALDTCNSLDTYDFGLFALSGICAHRMSTAAWRPDAARMLERLDSVQPEGREGTLMAAAKAAVGLAAGLERQAGERQKKRTGGKDATGREIGQTWFYELASWGRAGRMPGDNGAILAEALACPPVAARLAEGLAACRGAGEDSLAWLAGVPPGHWLVATLEAGASELSGRAADPAAWWLQPGFLAPAVASLSEQEAARARAALMAFAPDSVARLDASRLAEGSNGRRRRRA